MKKEERILKRLIKNIPEGLLIVDKTGVITYSNKAMAKITGVEASLLTSKNINSVFDAGDLKNLKKRFAKAIETLNKISFEEDIPNSEDIIKSVIGWFEPITTGRDNEYNGMVINIKEITKEKNILLEIAANEKKYSSVFNNLQEGVALYKVVFNGNNSPPEYVFIDCNPTFETLTGFKKEEAQGNKSLEAIIGQASNMFHFFNKVAQTGIPRTIIHYSDSKDKYFDIKVFSPEKNYFAVALNDVTENVIMQKELSESEKKFRSIIEESPMGIIIYHLLEDGKLILTDSNQACSNILGIDVTKLHSKTIEEAFPFLSQTNIPDIYKEIAGSGKTWHSTNVEYNDNLINGIYEIHAFQGTPQNVVVQFLDVTERRKNEHEIQKYKNQLEDLVAERTIELEDKYKELEHMNELFIGREFRIKELKEKVKMLERKINLE